MRRFVEKVLLCGSKQIGTLPENVLREIDEYIDRGSRFLIGDCHGADLTMQRYLHGRGVRRVTVYCSGTLPRYNVGDWAVVKLNDTQPGGYEFYRLKDERMIRDADCGLAVWNGKSKGTLANVRGLFDMSKIVQVFLSEKGQMKTVCSYRDYMNLYDRKN